MEWKVRDRSSDGEGREKSDHRPRATFGGSGAAKGKAGVLLGLSSGGEDW